MAFRGELLKAWRKAQDLTQAEAGAKVNVTQGFWRGLEAGTRQPSLDTLSLISRVTGFSTDELLGNPTQPLPAQKPEQENENSKA